jgi:glycerophosphoryl diester phosphodiesterase
MRRVSLLGLILVAGCGFLDAGPVEVEAHRAARGNWPQNSRLAVERSVDREYAAIEVDLVLTQDGVPVLNHDPWLDARTCVGPGQTPIAEESVLIQELTLAQLQQDYECGGTSDPDFPDQELRAESLMTLDELIVELAGAPDMRVHLDVKYEPGDTPAPQVMAEAILGRWDSANLPNPYYATANLPEMIQALEVASPGVPTALIWPRFPPGGSDVAVALSNELATAIGVRELVDLARAADADGIAVPYQVIDRQRIEFARQEGLSVHVWTPNSEALLKRFCRWPLDSLITDYPERAPCF